MNKIITKNPATPMTDDEIDELISKRIFCRPMSARMLAVLRNINQLKWGDALEAKHFKLAIPIVRKQIKNGVPIELFLQSAFVYPNEPAHIYYVGKYSLNVVEHFAKKKNFPLLKFDLLDHKVYVFMLKEIIEWNKQLTPEIWSSKKDPKASLEYSVQDLLHDRCIIIPRSGVYGVDPTDPACPAMLAVPVAGKHIAGKVGSYRDSEGNVRSISFLMNYTYDLHKPRDDFSAKHVNILDVLDWKHRIKCYRDAYGHDSTLSALIDACSSDREYEASDDITDSRIGKKVDEAANEIADALAKRHEERQKA